MTSVMPMWGDVFGTDDAGLTGLCHVRAAEAGEGCAWEGLAEGVDDLRAIEVAGGLAGGEEEVRVGIGGDVLV